MNSKNILNPVARVLAFAVILLIWWWTADQPFSPAVDLAVILGGVFLMYPIVFLGRSLLNDQPGVAQAEHITTFVHYTIILPAGMSIIRAVVSRGQWPDWTLPIPADVGGVLAILTGGLAFLSVFNLAVRGLGAPFAISLSRQLSVDWMYAWTRNPMVVTTLSFLVCLALWFRSALFMAYAVLWFAPALLVFVKFFEERELELRFGQSYLDYKAKVPMLIPRRPRE